MITLDISCTPIAVHDARDINELRHLFASSACLRISSLLDHNEPCICVSVYVCVRARCVCVCVW